MKTLVLLILLPVRLCSQTVHDYAGAGMVVGATSANGIVIAADSRTDYKDYGKEIGFMDGTQKIFIIGTHTIAIAGSALMDGVALSSIVADCFKGVDTMKNGAVLINDFIAYCKKTFTPAGFTAFFQNAFIITAGYENGLPHVYSYAMLHKPAIHTTNKGFEISVGNAATMKSYQSLWDTCKNYQVVAQQTEKFIYQTAAAMNKLYEIGGRIQLVVIEPTGHISWYKNKPQAPRWENAAQYNQDFAASKLPFNYAERATKKDLAFLLDSLEQCLHQWEKTKGMHQ